MDSNAEDLIQTIVTLVSTWGLQVIGAFAVLIVGRIVAGSLRRVTRRALERAELDPVLVPFFASVVYYLTLIAVVIAVLSLFGIETTSLVAVLGAAGLAVGLALQGTLSNFAAGVMLLIFRPFKVGNYVEVAGTGGSVQEVGLFSTVLHSPDNVRIIIPNAAVFSDTIKNYSANDTRRNDLVIGISYDDDIARAIQTIDQMLSADSRVLEDPGPTVAVGELADSSVNLVVRPWCAGADYWALRFDLTRKLKEELEAAGCSIPYPQQDVHLRAEASTS
jgi:small conductance mechanosensitive channel